MSLVCFPFALFPLSKYKNINAQRKTRHPGNKNIFAHWPQFSFGNFKSVSVFQMEREEHAKFLTKRFQRFHSQENTTSSVKFDFREVATEDVAVQIKKLTSNKASLINSIPARILKENSDIFCTVIQNLYNYGLSTGIFPKELRAGDISSLFKKEDAFIKENYRPITVLPSASKIYEKMMQDQMLPFVQSFLSPLFCGFREGYGTQHTLLHFVETCKRSMDSGGVAGAVRMDLSKAFDCLNHELLIAKLNAYGFSRSALLFIHSYLTNRKQRVKVNGSFSTGQKPSWVYRKVQS